MCWKWVWMHIMRQTEANRGTWAKSGRPVKIFGPRAEAGAFHLVLCSHTFTQFFINPNKCEDQIQEVRRRTELRLRQITCVNNIICSIWPEQICASFNHKQLWNYDICCSWKSFVSLKGIQSINQNTQALGKQWRLYIKTNIRNSVWTKVVERP